MRWKPGLVGLSYVASVLLANVCLMDITQAIEPATSSDPIPVSYVDAKECPWVKIAEPESDPTIGTKRSPCESGHCITTPSPEISCFGKDDPPPAPTISALPAPSAVIHVPSGVSPPPEITESPPLVAVTTVVLRR